jgi:hypothetical protein
MGADKRRSIDLLGQRLMVEVLTPARDTMKLYTDFESADGAHLRRRFETLRNLSAREKHALDLLVEESIIVALHAFLRLLEQDQDNEEKPRGHLRLMIADDNGNSQDVAEVSDGLGGELFGWLARSQKI